MFHCSKRYAALSILLLLLVLPSCDRSPQSTLPVVHDSAEIKSTWIDHYYVDANGEWKDWGINQEEVTVQIPGLSQDYTFVWLSDLHIITENDEIAEADRETVAERRESFKNAAGMYAEDFWAELPEALDDWQADALLFGGDMIDYAANANIATLKAGLDSLNTPYIYVRADHDYSPDYCEVQDQAAINALHADIDGYEEIELLEYDDLCVVGINNSTRNMTEEGLARWKEIYALGKPIILVTHVPLDSMIDESLGEQSRAVWSDRELTWGADCNYVPNEVTQEFLDMVYADDSLVKEVLAGHLHFSWDGALTEHADEHVFAPAINGTIGVIHVTGE